jgi:hypothetical protein
VTGIDDPSITGPNSGLDNIPVTVASPMPLGPRDLSLVEPIFHPFVERFYERLPQVWRVMDARQEWTLKRWLAGMCAASCDMDDMLYEMWGSRPVGPIRATPYPAGMSSAELQAWLDARQSRPSGLGDPAVARPAWLPWMAQLAGVALPPGIPISEQRDAIRYATSGWHAGNSASISAAARSALRSSKFSRVIPGWRPDERESGRKSTQWDVTIITRTSETPSPQAVLDAIISKGVKPAGVFLYHAAYEAPWQVIEALRPTWLDWERTRNLDGETFHDTTWTELEETGLSYADVPGQKFDNASFEAGVASWTASGGSIEPVAGGVDGFGAARLTSLGTVSAAYTRTNLFPDPSFEQGVSRARLGAVRTGVTAQPVTWSDVVQAPDGSRYGYVNITSNSSASNAQADTSVRFDPVPVTAGVTYRFQLAANCTGGQTGWAHLGVEWLDANGVVLTGDAGVVNGANAQNTQLPSSSLWRTLTLTAAAPTGAAQVRLVEYMAVLEPGVTRTMRFDTLLIERQDTSDGTWFAGSVNVPASTPGIDVKQTSAKPANYREDYRVAINIRPLDRALRLRVLAQFANSSGSLVDQQIVDLGVQQPGGWRRTGVATFRTDQFAATIDVTLQFREMINGQLVDIDATELRSYTGGSS